MANHVAQQIRDRIVTDCTGLATSGSNVYASRVYPHEAAKLPSVNVIVGPEEIEPARQTMGHTSYNRNLQILIQLRASTTSDIDATLLTMQKEVETALANDETINGIAKASWLIGSGAELSGEANQEIGLRTLSYLVQYVTTANAPETAE